MGKACAVEGSANGREIPPHGLGASVEGATGANTDHINTGGCGFSVRICFVPKAFAGALRGPLGIVGPSPDFFAGHVIDDAVDKSVLGDRERQGDPLRTCGIGIREKRGKEEGRERRYRCKGGGGG